MPISGYLPPNPGLRSSSCSHAHRTTPTRPSRPSIWTPGGKSGGGQRTGGTRTLHRVAVHLLVDIARHAGHADILREVIDGSIGYLPGNTNLPDRDEAGWAEHYNRVEAAARQAADS